jgi:hypothetical protein
MYALSLGTISTPVPVIVRSMVPEVVKRLPPVQVANWPPPDLVAIHWAQGGVIVALIALAVAVITLTRVNKQIVLANQALNQAVEELQVTRESNNLVRQDLEFSRTQAFFVSRRAKLALSHNQKRIEHVTSQFGTEQPEIGITVRLWMFNDGDVTARDATLFLWLPWPEWGVPEWDGIHNPEKPFAAQGLRAIANVRIGTKPYWHVSADIPFPTYPGVERLALTFQAILPLPYKGDLLWRIGYDDGIQPPASEPEGRLRFNLVRKS